MTRIAITAEAFEAIAAALPLATRTRSTSKAKGSSGSTGRLSTGGATCAALARASATLRPAAG
jgi:hypothetical protein